MKNRSYIIVAIILAVAFLAGNFVYPQFLKLPNFPNVPFKLGLDLQGGTHLLYQADLANIEKKDSDQAMDGLRDVIERRINFFGVAEPVVQVQGQRLSVELAGIIDPQEAIRQIGQTPFLEFKELKPNYEEIAARNDELLKEGEKEGFEDPFQTTGLTGRYLKKAKIDLTQSAFNPVVLIEFDDDGAELFEQITEKNVGKQLAIYIDDNLISSPTVQEKIAGGHAQISGSFAIEEAKFLARNLNAGALPVPISLISQQSVGPTLGKVSLEKSLKAGLFGFLIVIIFMVFFYRLPGLLASLALVIYVALVLALFKLIPITLTLAGIAGFILSIGMAVDANILIFSRMKEELKTGKSFLISVSDGFKRAWPSIRDSNLNTLIVSSILFTFGTSFVKGFAFTLILGVLVSMFSAIFVTQNLLKLFHGTKAANNKIWW
ncbi:MAG: protein translocase subunit SecD [bacterium]